MKHFFALAFLAVASAVAPETLDTAEAFAPIRLTPDAVRVVDAPAYQPVSRSELETIRIELPEVRAPVVMETVRVIEAPVEVSAPVAAEAGETDQVRVVDAPLPVPNDVEQVKVIEAPQPIAPEVPSFRPMPQYDNDMLR